MHTNITDNLAVIDIPYCPSVFFAMLIIWPKSCVRESQIFIPFDF